MQVFVTGTDTNIGKTLVSTWLCLHTGYDYFKPIQTGSCDPTDSEFVSDIIDSKVFPEHICLKAPLSPHAAARLENKTITLDTIKLPLSNHLIVEGAGGLMVPINDQFFMIDLIQQLSIPVILVASSRLGTINHTLLSLEALRHRSIDVLGVIFSGDLNASNKDAIQNYGDVQILAEIPHLNIVNRDALQSVPIPLDLKKILVTPQGSSSRNHRET
jgi:dethiobiotin synthetase